jgi:type III pantothenate kinase
MSLDALAERTALLPRAAIALPEAAIGADTIAAIGSGTVLGHRLLVEGLTRRIAAELAARSGVEPDVVRRILTGGFAATAWGATLEGFDARDPDLTLRGIALVGEHALGPAAPRRTEAAGSSR